MILIYYISLLALSLIQNYEDSIILQNCKGQWLAMYAYHFNMII